MVFVIDGTIHSIKKPSIHQEEFYRPDKKCHFITTQLLVDFDGNIIAATTNYPGRIHDFVIARRCDLFKEICGKFYAIADPGFNNVDFCVAGFRPSSIAKMKGKDNYEDYKTFDSISRSEQVIVENINSHIKVFKCLSEKFRHLLTGAVFICCGLYNWKRSLGYYQ